MKRIFAFLMVLICGPVISGMLLAAQGQSEQSALGGKKVRAFHFVLRMVSLEDARRLVDIAKDSGFNTVQLLIADGVKLNHSPWKPLPNAWGKAEFAAWVAYAKSKGLEIVPQFLLLTHQERFFQDRYPGLMFNRTTYDPQNEEVYKIVFPLIDELIALTHPKAFHIGHDELERLETRESDPKTNILSADLFLKDVLRLHSYLKKRGVETWIWGDMLIAPDEFPTMLYKHFNGAIPGYGKSLRMQLPKDIVICDWHYFDGQPDFPSLDVMQKEGFRVIGVTWKSPKTTRNFSLYAKQHNAYGMMATTWFHVQRKEWNVVEKILRESGDIFSKDFPNAK